MNHNLSIVRCVLVAAAAVFQPAGAAHAAAILLSDVRDITVQQLFRDAPGSILANFIQTNGVNASEDFVDAAGENLFQAPFGYTGSVSAFQESSYLPSEPGVGGSFNGLLFTGTSQTNSTITESDFRNDDIANSRAIVRFNLATPTHWSWDAEISGDASGDVQNLYYFGILDPVSGDPFFEDVRTGDFNQIVSQTGTLAPGEYGLFITARAFSSRQLTAGSGDGRVWIIDGQFLLAAIPEPGTAALLLLSILSLLACRGRRSAIVAMAVLAILPTSHAHADDIVWTGAQDPRFFSVLNNWHPNQIPGPDDVAIFDTVGTMDEDLRIFDGISNQRLIIRGADVRLAPEGTYSLTQRGAGAPPSLLVGTDGQSASLTLLQSPVANPPILSAGNAFVGVGAGSVGSLSVGENAVARFNNTLLVGTAGGQGFLTVQDGGRVEVPFANINSLTGSTGLATIVGPGSHFGVSELRVGGIATGTLNIEAGAELRTTLAFLGNRDGGNGTVNLLGPDTTWISAGASSFPLAVLVGGDLIGGSVASTATVNISDAATFMTPRNAVLGANAASTGTVNVSDGGAFITGQQLFVGSNGTGRLRILSGGRVEVGTTLNANSDSSILLDGGTLTAGELTASAARALDWRSGMLRLTGAAGLIVGSGSFGNLLSLNSPHHLIVDHQLTVQPGAFFLTRGSLATGGLVNSGNVILDSNQVDGPVTNAAGATITLFGDVTFNDLVDGPGGFFGPGTAVFNGGYSPGASPAVVPFEGSVRFGAANSLTVELAGLLDGQFDRLEVEGDAMLGGELVVSLLEGFQPRRNQRFTILDVAGSLTGQFDGLDEGALVGNFGGVDLFITYTGGDGNTVTLFTQVPEPTNFASLLIGGFHLLMHRRRSIAAPGSSF